MQTGDLFIHRLLYLTSSHLHRGRDVSIENLATPTSVKYSACVDNLIWSYSNRFPLVLHLDHIPYDGFVQLYSIGTLSLMSLVSGVLLFVTIFL